MREDGQLPPTGATSTLKVATVQPAPKLVTFSRSARVDDRHAVLGLDGMRRCPGFGYVLSAIGSPVFTAACWARRAATSDPCGAVSSGRPSHDSLSASTTVRTGRLSWIVGNLYAG